MIPSLRKARRAVLLAARHATGDGLQEHASTERAFFRSFSLGWQTCVSSPEMTSVPCAKCAQRLSSHNPSHSADGWDQCTIVDFMNRFPDTFQTVTVACVAQRTLGHGVKTMTRWLTNSGCIAQALNIPAITVRLVCRCGDRTTTTSCVSDEA